MKAGVAAPRWVQTLRFMARGGALVSPRAALELGEPLGLGRKTSISAFSLISTREGEVRIGARTDVGTGCCISGHPGGVSIGDDCLISPNVVIGGPPGWPPRSGTTCGSGRAR
jgi:serine acetyltransferase